MYQIQCEPRRERCWSRENFMKETVPTQGRRLAEEFSGQTNVSMHSWDQEGQKDHRCKGAEVQVSRVCSSNFNKNSLGHNVQLGEGLEEEILSTINLPSCTHANTYWARPVLGAWKQGCTKALALVITSVQKDGTDFKDLIQPSLYLHCSFCFRD